MSCHTIPNNNFVGRLQEICIKFKLNQPVYCDISDATVIGPSPQFRCTCIVGKRSSSGNGFNKKTAKQMAAQEMVQIIENENLPEVKGNSVDSEKAVSKLAVYCMKENSGQLPLYSDRPKEDGLFVTECTLQGFSAIGKGSNKKIAKEAAADSVATHFKVHEYWNNLKKIDARQEFLKNPISRLNELCQVNKLQFTFTENKILSGKVETYVVSCQVGKETTKSSENSSQKNARMEAAQLMCTILNDQTPAASPATPPSDEGQQVTGSKKRHSSVASSTCGEECNSNASSDDEPLVKRVNLNRD